MGPVDLRARGHLCQLEEFLYSIDDLAELPVQQSGTAPNLGQVSRDIAGAMLPEALA